MTLPNDLNDYQYFFSASIRTNSLRTVSQLLLLIRNLRPDNNKNIHVEQSNHLADCRLVKNTTQEKEANRTEAKR